MRHCNGVDTGSSPDRGARLILMKLSVEHILKAGSQLKTDKLNFDDPRVVEIFCRIKEAQSKLRKLKRLRQEDLLLIINI